MGRAQGHADKAKPDAEYIGTAFQVTPKYPTMYTRSMPGDIGFNVGNAEHANAAASGATALSTIASRTHNRTAGLCAADADQQMRHLFLQLPGMHSSDFLRHTARAGAALAAAAPVSKSNSQPSFSARVNRRIG